MIDVHAHISDEMYADTIDNIIADARRVGVSAIVDSGADISTSRRAVETANKYPDVFATVGIHPEYAHMLTSSEIDEIISLAKTDKVVAIGEIGLDYHYTDGVDKDTQLRCMIQQLEIAHALSKPVTLHIRQGYDDALTVLREHRGLIDNGLHLHCYSGNLDHAKAFSTFDTYYSFGGVITFKKVDRSDVINYIPRDRILLETDCPYLAPTPMRGTPNKPEYMRYTLAKMAEILGLSEGETDYITTTNAQRLFNI